MKILNSLFFALLTLSLVVTSCNSKKGDETTVSTATDSLGQNPTTTVAAPAGSQHHFICPNNCEGSGGSEQANCPVCGTAYVHNQAFHNQSPTATPGTQATPIQIDANGSVTQPAQNPTAAAQPVTDTPANPAAKNAKGEWHFVCSKACGGGAGAQGNCPKCGSPLTHNQAFHQ